MKIKYIVSLLLVSAILIMVGAMAKLQHWPWAGNVLMSGMLLQVLTLLIVVIKVLMKKKNPDSIKS